MAVQPAVAPSGDNGDSAPPRKPLYEGSTQYKHWRYSEHQLREIRTLLNSTAVSAIKHAFEVDLPGSSENVSFLNAEEEHLLVKLYVEKVSQLCGHFRFVEEVEATAISYLKRFYLKNTVMDWHPKNVMLTALFLAAKTTNNPISLEGYTARIPKTSPSDVLELEFLVAQSLNFEFAVWHAHRALWGIYLDIQTLPEFQQDTSQKAYSLQEAYGNALKHVRASRLTDAEFIYTPSQIAVAAFSMAAPQMAASWIGAKGSEPMLPVISSVEAMIKRDGNSPDVEKVRDVDRRLKLCKNPEKIPGTKAYLARQAEEEAKLQEKRARKAEELKKAIENGDPFGNELSTLATGITEGDLDDDD